MRTARATIAAPLTAAAAAVLTTAWFALAAAGGLAASAVFPAARGLDLSMPEYAGFLSAEPELGRMMVAGHLAERVFELTGTLRVPVAALAALAVAAFIVVRGWRLATVLAAIALLTASGAMAASVWWLQPDFQRQDARYREAARAGDAERARAEKPAVDASHASASRAAGTEALALLVLAGLVAATAPAHGVRQEPTGA
ncbi:MAG: hypothetical protein RI967_492 [Planctomycetota bacterium]